MSFVACDCRVMFGMERGDKGGRNMIHRFQIACVALNRSRAEGIGSTHQKCTVLGPTGLFHSFWKPDCSGAAVDWFLCWRKKGRKALKMREPGRNDMVTSLRSGFRIHCARQRRQLTMSTEGSESLAKESRCRTPASLQCARIGITSGLVLIG